MGKKRSLKRIPPALSGNAMKAHLIVFIASFCTLVIELVASRILAPHVGVSLYTWTSIIGVVLAGISAGAYLGGRIADRFPRPSTLGWLLFLSGLGAFAISPLTNFIAPFHLHFSLMTQILVITALIFFIPSCLLGMISPVVIKLTLGNLASTGNVVGRIYACSTLGSIVGTFATGFFLISWMGTRNVLFTMGAILVLSAPVFGGFFMSKKTLFIFFFLFIPLLWALYGYAFKPPLEEGTILFKESDYYTIQLKKSSETADSKLITLYIDNLTHSCSDLKNPFNLVYHYIQCYEEIIRWQAAKRGSFRTLFIGGGGYTFPRFIEAKYPEAVIDVVEIDPEITRVSLAHLGVSKTSKIRTYNQDARWFVMGHQGKEMYDFIFMDAFNDLSVPYHLTTKEFSSQLKTLLKTDGILLANVIDSLDKGSFLPSYTRTLQEVFGKGKVHLVTLGAAEGYTGVSNFVVLASSKGLEPEDFINTLNRMRSDGILSRMMPQDGLEQLLKKHASPILTDDYVPVDNLIAPVFEDLYGSSK